MTGQRMGQPARSTDPGWEHLHHVEKSRVLSVAAEGQPRPRFNLGRLLLWEEIKCQIPNGE
jgi:hypothetical protein